MSKERERHEKTSGNYGMIKIACAHAHAPLRSLSLSLFSFTLLTLSLPAAPRGFLLPLPGIPLSQTYPRFNGETGPFVCSSGFSPDPD